jgi:hypothetical protein
VDDDALLPMRGAGLFVAGQNAVLAHDVDLAEQPADLLGDRLARFLVEVEDRNLDAGLGKRLGAGPAQPRRTAGDGRGER